MRPRRYYAPVERGLEIRIREKLAHLREMDRTARAGARSEAPSEAGAGAPGWGTP